MVANPHRIVKGASSLTPEQKVSLSMAFGNMGINIFPGSIKHILLHNREDNYFEVITVSGSFYVHRPSLRYEVSKLQPRAA